VSTLRTDIIENPCVQLLVKISKVTLPLYIYFGVLIEHVSQIRELDLLINSIL
jgi:hypothetical protein